MVILLGLWLGVGIAVQPGFKDFQAIAESHLAFRDSLLAFDFGTLLLLKVGEAHLGDRQHAGFEAAPDEFALDP